MNKGDYVRTKHYGITKVLKIYNNTTTNYLSAELDKIDSFGRLGVSASNDEIIKSSPNIIDLIEVGDYVNGEKVTPLMIRMRDEQGVFGLPDSCEIYIDEIKVKSIVTKEQFSAMEYKVESEVK